MATTTHVNRPTLHTYGPVAKYCRDILSILFLLPQGSIREQGKIMRQGDLVVYERHHKHNRRVFLFENTIILAKTKKSKKHPEIPGSEIFEFRSAYKVQRQTCLVCFISFTPEVLTVFFTDDCIFTFNLPHRQATSPCMRVCVVFPLGLSYGRRKSL